MNVPGLKQLVSQARPDAFLKSLAVGVIPFLACGKF